MKKSVFYFILHIGCALAIFNPFKANAKEEDYSSMVSSYTYEVKNFAAPVKDGEKSNKVEPLIKSNNELAKMFFVPLLIDKLYPDEKINQDFTTLLGHIYPGTKPEDLQTMQTWIQFFVSAKRRYTYVVNALEQKVKALAMLPKDAPVIAEDGEYAAENPDLRKQTPEGEYAVSYTPYKYLEYDTGETGEPVRRRDKNYVESPDISDEVALALLKFDIPAFYRALKKVPKYTDGSGEKPITLPNGIQARLLLDVSHPGDVENIKGVIDVYVPKGYYINGDYLNTAVRPRFFLSEDKNNSHNIKNYQLFHPAPAGVVKKGQNKRLFTKHIRFPIEFTRQDTNKGIKVKGSFQFVVCDKNSTCQPMQTNHELTLKPSENHVFSIHNNYVTQAFTHLPQEESPHAKLKSVEYSPQTKKLQVRFSTSRHFSNVAVMAEDSIGTNYTNPRYAISDKEIIAEFDAPAKSSGQEIAVTAILNDYESLRNVVTPQIIYTPGKEGFRRAGAFDAFIFGVFLNLMPGIMYLFIRLTGFLWQRKHYVRIFLRYALGTALGFILLTTLYHKRYFSEMYTNVWLIAAAGLIVTSFLSEGLGYMDFALFRPLGGKIRRGLLCGFFSVILCATLPMYLAPEVFSSALSAPTSKTMALITSAWGGMLFLPLLMLLFRRQRSYFLIAMHRFNVFYNILFLGGLLTLLYLSRGIFAACLLAFFLALILGLWYVYPLAVKAATKHTRSIKRQGEIFQRVQKYALGAVLTTYLLLVGFLWLFQPSKPQTTLSPQQVYQLAAQENSHNTPVLVVITADWSITSWLNRKDIHLLNEAGIKVIHIPAQPDASNVMPWFAKYGKNFAPLNILFTNRHPDGLVIPDKLQQLNWKTALTELEERKPAND